MPDYRVVRSGMLLGTLSRAGIDPDSEPTWWVGEFDPAPGFESILAVIERERRHPVAADSDGDYWGRAWPEIGRGMVLEPLDGRKPITEFFLEIDVDDRKAAWRY